MEMFAGKREEHMKTKVSGIAVLLGVGLAFAGMSVQAATAWTRNLDTGTTTGTAPSVAIGGYADNNGSGNLVYVAPTEYAGNGYGLCSSSDVGCTVPNHALDNFGNKESLLLSFGSAVNLASVTIGYANTDSDISVLAYTGAGNPAANGNLTGHSYSQLAANGWTVIGNYADLTVGAAQALGTTVSSSYWLVAAYNSTFGTCTGCTNSNDYVKLYEVAGNTTPSTSRVPEPSALLLAGSALFGVIGLRRRRT
jgi:hypothetical protein